MRRLQMYIDEDLDDLLSVEARRAGRSKAALIRDAVRDHYRDHQVQDPFDDWVGSIDVEPGDVDAVVYDG